MLRVLTLTTLFPNSASPRHGIFVETRLRKLVECAGARVDVIAPVPWFPLTWPGFGRYAAYAAAPDAEERHGMHVQHPRYWMIPKLGMSMQPDALAAAFWRAARGLLDRGLEFDVVDAHYLYPDVVAAAVAAQRLGLPLVATARGSDVNLIAQSPGPWRRIEGALAGARSVLTVSEALRRRLIDLGMRAGSIETLRNGVDAEIFAPRGRAAMRERLEVDREPLLVSVGNLVPEKGHDLVLSAAAKLADARVVIVGRGRERERLADLTRACGMKNRVTFLDNMPQHELAQIYSAADVLALGSSREGWPNVLLEAMACGTSVVATDVGGVAEIAGDAPFARIVRVRDPDAFAAALREVIDSAPDRAAVRTYALRFDWATVAQRYAAVLSAAASAGPLPSLRPCLESR